MSAPEKQRPAALVTGARRGIGRAIALELGRAGFDVALVDLVRDDELNAAALEVQAAGGRSIALAADIAELSRHEALLDAAETALGALHCLVNNAGVPALQRGDLFDVTAESYDRCQAVNTRGTFFLTQAFAKRLLNQPHDGGPQRSIVTITSANALAASITRGEYCISKAGASMVSKLFAVRLADHDIGVYEVQPGIIETPMTAPAKAHYDAEIARGLTLVRRWGSPQEVARVVSTLVSGGLPFTVGQAIAVDGGLLMQRF
jgi:NAD(P)-dependent dehydrogenase (short-subunit alcohol dehydrogenase family)